MQFLLYISLPYLKRAKIIYDFSNLKNLNDNSLVLQNSNNIQTINYESQDERIIIIGDLISEYKDKIFEKHLLNSVKNERVFEYGGFYYLIYISDRKKQILVFSSLFGILPIYYYAEQDKVFISSKISLLVNSVPKSFDIDRQYILERTFFNYGLFQRTFWEGIKIVPSNSHISIGQIFELKNKLNIENYFQNNLSSGKKELENLAEMFIEKSKKYFPNEKFAISFTGGFDSRTLVSIAKHLSKDFNTYSFGTSDAEDVLVPQENSKEIDVEYQPILLDDNYVFSHSLDDGLQLIMETEGLASFARAHYLYAVELLSKDVRYIITGNFGSELFRAFHNPGVVVSEELVKYFELDENEWFENLRKSLKWNYLRKEKYVNEFSNIIEDVRKFKREHEGLRKNELFYIFIFEEVFRKYFGPEIIMQNNFLSNRSPYLDFGFIKELLKTKYSGVYSEFFTNNLIKRYKGQLPYAFIINKCLPEMMKLKTGKGYYIKDLIGYIGKLKLIKHKLFNTKKEFITKEDPYAVMKSFYHNLNFYKRVNIFGDFFNEEFLSNAINEISYQNQINNYILILSTNYYLNKIINKRDEV